MDLVAFSLLLILFAMRVVAEFRKVEKPSLSDVSPQDVTNGQFPTAEGFLMGYVARGMMDDSESPQDVSEGH